MPLVRIFKSDAKIWDKIFSDKNFPVSRILKIFNFFDNPQNQFLALFINFQVILHQIRHRKVGQKKSDMYLETSKLLKYFNNFDRRQISSNCKSGGGGTEVW